MSDLSLHCLPRLRSANELSSYNGESDLHEVKIVTWLFDCISTVFTQISTIMIKKFNVTIIITKFVKCGSNIQ